MTFLTRLAQKTIHNRGFKTKHQQTNKMMINTIVTTKAFIHMQNTTNKKYMRILEVMKKYIRDEIILLNRYI